MEKILSIVIIYKFNKSALYSAKNIVRWMECYGHVMDFESTNLYRFHCIVNMWTLSCQHIWRKYVFHKQEQKKMNLRRKKSSIKFKQNRDTISTKLILKKTWMTFMILVYFVSIFVFRLLKWWNYKQIACLNAFWAIQKSSCFTWIEIFQKRYIYIGSIKHGWNIFILHS